MNNFNKFDILFEHVMSILSEGGNAVHGVSKIKRENIKPTVNKIFNEILEPAGITPETYTSEIGSAGKKAWSGDLDLAVNYEQAANKNDTTVDDIKAAILDELNSLGYEYNQTGGNINMKFPIQGDQEGEFVQVDLIPVRNINFVKYRFYSPREEDSKYKALHRIHLLGSIIKTMTMEAAEEAREEGEFISPDGVSYPASTFKHITMNNDGFFEVVKSFIGAKGKINKHEKKDESRTRFISDDPQRMLDMLFGKGRFTIADTDSFETIWNNILMSDAFPKEKRGQVIKGVYFGLKNSGAVIPNEIIEWLEENDPAFLEQNK